MYISLRKTTAIITAIALVVAVFAVALVGPAQLVEASARAEVCDAIGGSGGAGNCSTNDDTNVSDAVAAVINILTMLIGAIAIIMIMVGGIKYVTSGGDANSTKTARDTIIYALIGLVVAALGQALVRFVLQRV